MLFDERYNKVIEILKKYDENFAAAYDCFVSKIPEKLKTKCMKEEIFSKKVKDTKFSYWQDSRLEHGFREYISILPKKDAFYKLQYYPERILDEKEYPLCINRILNLIIRENLVKETEYDIFTAIENSQPTLFINRSNHKFETDRKTIKLTQEEYDFIIESIDKNLSV